MTLHPDFCLNGRSYGKKELWQWTEQNKFNEGEEDKHLRQFLKDWLSLEEEIQVHTSGSTGHPKPIAIRKEYMINSALATGEFLNLNPKNSALLCLSMGYIAGKMMLVRAMVLGLDLTIIPPSSAPLEKAKRNFDFAAMVPMQVANSLDKLNLVNTLIIGGAPLSIELRQKLAKLQNSCFETFGMTETVSHIAMSRIDTHEKSPFKALPGVSFSVDDQSCLRIRAPKVSKTEVETNDVVELVDDSSFFWLGRSDFVINSGGAKIHPEQVEAKLKPFIPTNFFIYGIPNTQLGEEVSMFIEGDTQLPPLELLAEKAGLSRFQIPKTVYFLPEFIYTSSNKIKRKATVAAFLKTKS